MLNETRTFSLPRWRFTRWLADAGPDVPDAIRVSLIASLFGTLPVFAGGIVNTLAVSGVLAWRVPTAPFLAWLALESMVCLARLAVLVLAYRRARAGLPTPTDIYLVLALCWSASVGYGALISMASGDWVAATLACVSAAAMVGGIAFRNFGAPRLVALMILLSLGPCGLGAALSGEPAMLVVFIQLPAYFIAMSLAAVRLNKMMVATMRAERENDHRARHDALTGLSNRSGLAAEIAPRNREAAGVEPLALLYLDLDGFKTVNDTHGHPVGDRLLRLVAERLRGVLRAGDSAARVGGDEFVVVARGVDATGATEFGQRLIGVIAVPYDLDDAIVARVGVSIGIALAPEHGGDVDTLLAAADDALYKAKSWGKGRCAVASAPDGTARIAHRAA